VPPRYRRARREAQAAAIALVEAGQAPGVNGATAVGERALLPGRTATERQPVDSRR
jgi:UDP-GlcNAc:undecaprenyl-phosphate GlcNAc-1-phosphate transferase